MTAKQSVQRGSIPLEEFYLTRAFSLLQKSVNPAELLQGAVLEVCSAQLHYLEKTRASILQDISGEIPLLPITSLEDNLAILEEVEGIKHWNPLRLKLEWWRIRVQIMCNIMLKEGQNLNELYQFLDQDCSNAVDVWRQLGIQMDPFMVFRNQRLRALRTQSERLVRLTQNQGDRIILGFASAKSVFDLQEQQYERSRTRGINRLTWLASIFIPFSLAASITGLQSRFSNLGPRLYDFFGIAVFLCIIIMIALYLEKHFQLVKIYLRFGSFAAKHEKDMTAEETKSMKDGLKFCRRFLLSYILAFLVLLFSFFALCMKGQKHVILAKKVLGYGAIPFVVVLVFVILILSLPRRWTSLEMTRKLKAQWESSKQEMV